MAITGIKHSLSNAEFMGISLIYTSIPIVAMALIVAFIKNEIRAKNWSHVAGHISNVEKKRTLTSRKIKIEYKYYVNDIGYINDVYSSRSHWSTLGQLMLNSAFRNGNPESWKGKRVKVYYNKEDIWDSMLEKNTNINLDLMAVPSLTVLCILSYSAWVIIL